MKRRLGTVQVDGFMKRCFGWKGRNGKNELLKRWLEWKGRDG